MKKDYSQYTYNSKNPMARFAHRSRFSNAIKLVLEENFESILDYGAGDNKFLLELDKQTKGLQMFSFEPVMNISSTDSISVFSSLKDLPNRKFDIITCFETLEHFGEKHQLFILNEFFNRLENYGKVIISVPIEIGLPSLIKNLRRLAIGRFTWSFAKNSLKSVFALDIPEVRSRDGYIPSHMGFNHKKLEHLIHENFEIVKTITSPLDMLSDKLNSQIFYVLKKKKK